MCDSVGCDFLNDEIGFDGLDGSDAREGLDERYGENGVGGLDGRDDLSVRGSNRYQKGQNQRTEQAMMPDVVVNE